MKNIDYKIIGKINTYLLLKEKVGKSATKMEQELMKEIVSKEIINIVREELQHEQLMDDLINNTDLPNC